MIILKATRAWPQNCYRSFATPGYRYTNNSFRYATKSTNSIFDSIPSPGVDLKQNKNRKEQRERRAERRLLYFFSTAKCFIPRIVGFINPRVLRSVARKRFEKNEHSWSGVPTVFYGLFVIILRPSYISSRCLEYGRKINSILLQMRIRCLKVLPTTSNLKCAFLCTRVHVHIFCRKVKRF